MYSVWPLRLDSVKLKSATGHTTRIWTVVMHSNSFRPDFNWICTTSDIDRQSEQGLLLWDQRKHENNAFYNDNWQNKTNVTPLVWLTGWFLLLFLWMLYASGCPEQDTGVIVWIVAKVIVLSAAAGNFQYRLQRRSLRLDTMCLMSHERIKCPVNLGWTFSGCK